MKPSDSAHSGPRTEIDLWRAEVREFCEDTLRQLQQLTSMLESDLSSAEESRGSVNTDTVSRVETQTLVVPSSMPDEPKPASNDGLDNSRSRLENLKRQLSEKLRQSDSKDPR